MANKFKTTKGSWNRSTAAYYKEENWSWRTPPSPASQLKKLLANPELDIYTAVILARRCLAKGDLRSAIAQLAVDADKLRGHDYTLYQLVNQLYDQNRLALSPTPHN
jgi:hypothetical protein